MNKKIHEKKTQYLLIAQKTIYEESLYWLNLNTHYHSRGGPIINGSSSKNMTDSSIIDLFKAYAKYRGIPENFHELFKNPGLVERTISSHLRSWDTLCLS